MLMEFRDGDRFADCSALVVYFFEFEMMERIDGFHFMMSAMIANLER